MTLSKSRQNSMDNDIVISGMSGQFPFSRTVDEFSSNLHNKVSMVNDDESRFKHTNPQIPRSSGKLLEVEKFDRDFFGFSEEQVGLSDIQCRCSMEECFKCIMDAGVNPFSLRGTNTAVYFGASNAEHTFYILNSKSKNPYGFTGISKSLWPGRVSHFLGLEGPAFNVDTACSSSLTAIFLAVKAIEEGKVDAALVCGTNACINPNMSLQFALLGVLSMDGKCRSFDSEANGYARSEAVASVFLQRRRDAKRVYATVISSKANCDGFKIEGITFPSSAMQERLLKEIYTPENLNLDDLGYIEAHATATSVGDPEECRAIDNAICLKRSEPLLIGSVKSNCGHAEPAAGTCSLVKALLALNSGIIPPNINFKKFRESIEGIKQGRMIVVTNATKLPKPYVGVNSFGFGGANVHLLIKQYDQIKDKTHQSQYPRLVVWCGRTEDSVTSFFADLENMLFDEDYIALAHSSQAGGIPGMNYRGFAVLQADSSNVNPIALQKSVKYVKQVKPAVVWVFSGAGAQWTGMGKALMELPLFKQSIQKSQNTLKPSGLDLMQILSSTDASIFNNVLYSFVSTAALQIACVDLLRAVGVSPDFTIGHGVGELGCAYANGCLSAEQMILAAYYRGKVDMESNKIKESMAPKLLNYLQHIISKPQLRTCKWITSSAPKHQWFLESNKYASAEYFTKSLLQSNFFEDALSILPRNAIALQIVPHTLIHESLIKSMPHAMHIELLQSNDNNALLNLLCAVGSIYTSGVEMSVDKLYPEISLPVSRGTKNLSSHVLLDHTEKHFVYKFSDIDGTCGKTTFSIKLEDDYLYLRGHEIDGRVLVPATFYIECVWRSLVNIRGGLFENQAVEFENIRFERATTLPPNTTIELTVVVNKENGAFEVTEAGSLVVTGIVRPIVNKKQPNAIKADNYDNFSPLESKNFYKELKLRGYHYNELFQTVDSAFMDGALGKIKWIDNWVTFMDCMLQLAIIRLDMRTLVLPTKIRFLRIYPQYHKKHVINEPVVKAQYSSIHDRMVVGGIELVGLEASSVHRRRAPGDPVLEHYSFIPHFPAPKQSLEDVARCCIQLALENQPRTRLELVYLDAKDENYNLLSAVLTAIGELPLMTANCNVIHHVQTEINELTDLNNVTHILPSDECDVTNSFLIITNKSGLKASDRNTSIVENMETNGFIILREAPNLQMNQLPNIEGYIRIGVFPSTEETVIIFKNVKSMTDVQKSKILRINSSDTTFKWLEELQKLVETETDIILLSDDDKLSGVVGLGNCLTKEPDTKHIRVVFVSADDKVPFKITAPDVVRHLQLGLVVNIYKNGQWGSLRHLKLKTKGELKACENHVYGNIKQIGDLSSLTWMDGPIVEQKQKVRVVYSSLNFKDVMQASGRLPMQEMGASRVEQTCIFGFEYSGVSIADGKRVMGMTYQGAVSSHIDRVTPFEWQVPDNWSLKDAATVPVVYLTVYYAFFYTADIRKGKTILIHAGTGGIGIAAIRTAQAYGLEVYTTVSTPGKKEFLLKTFPTLKECNIGNSRDTSFEDLIMTRTQGRGVDFVLNSLSEDKLKASIRCLAKGGHFMEIGKFDLAKDNPLNLAPFQNALTFHTIFADYLIGANKDFVQSIKQHMNDDMIKGIIQPLPTTIYKAHQIEEAFRYLMSGKHIGKVLLQVRENENSKSTLPVSVLPQTYFDPNLSYIIPGGLGGFGLELVDWMIIRGARLIVLSSSRGITNDYQQMRISIWKRYNCKIIINTANIANEKGCLELVQEAIKLGPVGGIFNLAVMLRDAIFSNQTKELFEQSFAPKAYATKYLDQISRKMCPKLQHFVIFSSVSCGRGNAGQTNYGMANSIMERIVEDRVAHGLPGKAIQWGAVGEVGLVANMAEGKIDLEIGGTLQQRISSCLEVLDDLLNCPYPVVASMVVAEKKAQSLGQSPLEFVLNAMSIRDAKSVSMNSTLTELGMDSLLSVEIKQTFERDYDIALTTADLRSLTLAQLAEISQNIADSNLGAQQQKQQQTSAPDPDDINASVETINHFYGYIPLSTDTQPVVPMNNVQDGNAIIFLPGIIGCLDEAWTKVGHFVKAPAYMIQLHTLKTIDVADYVDFALKHITELLKQRNTKNFQIVGYSMGALLSHFVIEKLEQMGYKGTALLVDGSPFYIRSVIQTLDFTHRGHELDKLIISVLLNNVLPKLKLQAIVRDLRNSFTPDEWFIYVQDNLIKYEHEQYEAAASMIQSIYQKSKILQNPDTYATIGIIASEIMLVKPTNKFVDDLDDTYGLSPFNQNVIQTAIIEGNHSTMLANPELIDIINAYFLKKRI